MKVLIALALAAVLIGVGVRFGRDRVDSAVHHAIDTSLPSVVGEHPWAPVVQGHVRRSERVSFQGGTVSTVRCHVDLGHYSLLITHRFSFQATGTAVPAHCPGRPLRRALTHATRADLGSGGSRLTFSDDRGRTVAVLRAGRG